MPDIFTPNPPPAPADCAVAPPAARSPTPKWLEDYFGPKPTPGGAAPGWINGINGLWVMPGFFPEYQGLHVVRVDGDFPASVGVTITVPAGHIWRFQTVGADWSQGSALPNRVALLGWYDRDGDIALLSGKTLLPASSGGPITFASCAGGPSGDPRWTTESLPYPLYLQAGWTIQLSLAPADVGAAFSEVRWIYEDWEVKQQSSTPPVGGGTPTGGGGNPYGGPWFVEG